MEQSNHLLFHKRIFYHKKPNKNWRRNAKRWPTQTQIYFHCGNLKAKLMKWAVLLGTTKILMKKFYSLPITRWSLIHQRKTFLHLKHGIVFLPSKKEAISLVKNAINRLLCLGETDQDLQLSTMKLSSKWIWGSYLPRSNKTFRSLHLRLNKDQARVVALGDNGRSQLSIDFVLKTLIKHIINENT